MVMIDGGEVGGAGRETRAVLFNHSSFYDITAETNSGMEVNVRLGRDWSALLMSQVLQAPTDRLQAQAGVGAIRTR